MSTVKKRLKIEGMHCTSCAMSIDMDLEELTGIKSVNTSYARQESEVEYLEDQITEGAIIAQIKKTGYTAKLCDANH